MSVFTPPNGTPKDVNNRLGSVKSLDPDDPNDTAFKLVTICVFILCRKKQTIFSFFVNRTRPPRPPCPPSIHSYPPPPLYPRLK
jgi:hypothetical protein